VTSAPHAPRLAAENIDDAIEALRARGLRLSATRQLVLDTLFAASRPLSAEQIALRLDLVATSVYRNLEILERHGLLHHVHLGHGPGLYALAVRGPREYIYCPDCATAKSVRPELLDPVRSHIKRRFGYEVSFAHFALVGICQACAAKRPPHPRSEDRWSRGSSGEHHRHQPSLATLAAAVQGPQPFHPQTAS
jgi:Fur family ferric uptake transcriptional regulator